LVNNKVCKFFSVVSNGKGKVLHFTLEQIQKIQRDGNPENYNWNSHTSIMHFNNIKGQQEDKWNKWEYDCEQRKLILDGDLNTKKNDEDSVKFVVEKYLTDNNAIYIQKIFKNNSGYRNSGDSNSGYRNSGDCNSGDRNSGDCNSGDCNSGYWNSGNWNSGDRNSGNRNSGYRNSGNWNSGYRNSGNSNSGDCNSGDSNSGDWNSGNSNSGDSNSGNWNSGYSNSGNWNSRNRNSGYSNSGNSNSGYRNSGNRNSGYCNSGYCNSGYRNSGNSNSGDSNSGNRNSGNSNSGNWNSGDSNSGKLNTTQPLLRIFNKPTKVENIIYPQYFYFELNEWVNISSMTDKEKENFNWYKTTGGYLKKIDYKESWIKSFNETTKKDVELTLNLPNFKYKLFEEISGITKKMIQNKIRGV